MPAKIKLTYFNAKGRAELSRLILAQAGATYDDVRIEREEWATLKQSKSDFSEGPRKIFKNHSFVCSLQMGYMCSSIRPWQAFSA
jgi:hypothetical protein